MSFDECTKGYRLLNTDTYNTAVSRDVHFKDDNNLCRVQKYIGKSDKFDVELYRINDDEVEQNICDDL